MNKLREDQVLVGQWEMDMDKLQEFINEALQLTTKHFPEPRDGCFYNAAFLAWLTYTFSVDEANRINTKQLAKNMFEQVFEILEEGKGKITYEAVKDRLVKDTIQ